MLIHTSLYPCLSVCLSVCHYVSHSSFPLRRPYTLISCALTIAPGLFSLTRSLQHKCIHKQTPLRVPSLLLCLIIGTIFIMPFLCILLCFSSDNYMYTSTVTTLEHQSIVRKESFVHLRMLSLGGQRVFHSCQAWQRHLTLLSAYWIVYDVLFVFWLTECLQGIHILSVLVGSKSPDVFQELIQLGTLNTLLVCPAFFRGYMSLLLTAFPGIVSTLHWKFVPSWIHERHLAFYFTCC